MKKWRLEARKYNLEEGKKHQGRKHKSYIDMNQFPSELVVKLFAKVGILMNRS